MTATDHWQTETVEKLKNRLWKDEGVLGLLLFGSLVQDDVPTDMWSDVDVAVVVRDEALGRFWPSTEWMSELGTVFCTSRHSTADWFVTRTYLANGELVDTIVVTEESLEKISGWPQNPLKYTNQCLFSRSAVLDRVIGTKFPDVPLKSIPAADFARMANDFWFKGMLAVSKVGRKELLVAIHLSLDMIRDCLVLAMMIRDRETGADHHRDGSQGNHFVEDLADTNQPYTPQGILDSVEHSAIAFDALAAQWDGAYKEQRYPLLNWIAQARRSLNDSK